MANFEKYYSGFNRVYSSGTFEKNWITMIRYTRGSEKILLNKLNKNMDNFDVNFLYPV